MVGFDDLPVARWVSPPLTTVRQPLAEMGQAAAQMFQGLGPGGGGRVVFLPDAEPGVQRAVRVSA